MFTMTEAQRLLSLEKKVEIGGVIYGNMNLSPPQPFEVRYLLIAEEEPDFRFLYEVTPSRKNLLKLSLYLMENETKWITVGSIKIR